MSSPGPPPAAATFDASKWAWIMARADVSFMDTSLPVAAWCSMPDFGPATIRPPSSPAGRSVRPGTRHHRGDQRVTRGEVPTAIEEINAVLEWVAASGAGERPGRHRIAAGR
jgi:hypothetical protein